MRDYVVEYGYYGLCPRHIHSDDFAYIALDDPMYYTCGIFYLRKAVLTPVVRDFISELRKYPFDYDI